MSFEGYYQKVCKNGHYFECDIYDDRDNCVDCCQDIIFSNIVDETNCCNEGFVRIPFDKVGDVDKIFFEKYLSSEQKIKIFKNRNRNLVDPICFEHFKDEYPLEKIIELFQYFDKTKTLKIEFKLMNDAENELVPYVFVSFGEINYNKNSDDYMQWKTMYINDYGIETNNNNGYECCQFHYDTDVRYAVIDLYKNMWNRCFKYNFEAKDN
jgi:hypothetical protein